MFTMFICKCFNIRHTNISATWQINRHLKRIYTVFTLFKEFQQIALVILHSHLICIVKLFSLVFRFYFFGINISLLCHAYYLWWTLFERNFVQLWICQQLFDSELFIFEFFDILLYFVIWCPWNMYVHVHNIQPNTTQHTHTLT